MGQINNWFRNVTELRRFWVKPDRSGEMCTPQKYDSRVDFLYTVNWSLDGSQPFPVNNAYCIPRVKRLHRNRIPTLLYKRESITLSTTIKIASIT